MARTDSSREILAGDLLGSISRALAHMPDSPQKRQLGSKAEGYRRTIEGWRTAPPTKDRRDAMYEMVLALHGKLIEVLRRNSLDLTPIRPAIDVDDDEPPPSSTPLGRVPLRGQKDRP